jgi:hypothetical protein
MPAFAGQPIVPLASESSEPVLPERLRCTDFLIALRSL